MPHRIDLFCEDSAHESCARALVMRIAREEQVSVDLRVASARFGIPRLKRELSAFQSVLKRRGGVPDILVVLVDANQVGPVSRRREVVDILDDAVFPRYVVGTPDPCVERWLLADVVSFASRFGREPDLRSTRRNPDWKKRLIEVLEQAGEIVTQRGAEFAEEIVAVMDLRRAGQVDPTIQAFADDLRRELRQLRVAEGTHP